MTIPQARPRLTKKAILLGLFGVITIGGIIAYIIITAPPAADITTSPSSTTPVLAPSQQQAPEDTAMNTHKPDAETETAPNPNSDLLATIVRAQQMNANNIVSIRTLVQGTTTGHCIVQLKNSNQHTIERTPTIAFEATTASCAVDIPINEFSTGGNWQLSVTAKNGNTTSAVATQTVVITK